MSTRRLRAPLVFALAAVVAMGVPIAPARAIDDAHEAKATASIDKAVAFLRAEQGADGSWSAEKGPAVTAMIVAGLTRHETLPLDDPMVAKAIAYVLSMQKENGGIYDKVLENYNTSIALMALGPIRESDPKIGAAVKKAQDYLRGLQWADGKQDAQGKPITKGHAWFGGQGYGSHGRPDLSNTAMMVAGLRDSGLDCNDPAYVRAMEFISQMQGSDQNTKFADKIEPGGGFVYASSVNKDQIGVPQSQAGEFTDANGRTRLRTYGSMTYAGFMSFLYARLDRDDPRVKDAASWLRHHYTLEENPGIGHEGYFYYLHLMARGLDAWTRGEPRGAGVDKPDTIFELADGKKVDWANDLIDKLASLQHANGSWTNEKAERWSEGDPHLATAYALLAIQHARK